MFATCCMRFIARQDRLKCSAGLKRGLKEARGDGVPVSNINRWPVAGEKTPRVVCSVQQDGLHDHRDIV